MRRIANILSGAVVAFERACLAGGILGIALLTIGNVLARTFTGHSLVFAEEVCQFLIVLVTFLGLGYAAGEGRHIRMTALYDQLPEHLRKASMTFISLTTSLLLFYLAHLATRYALDTVRTLGSVSPVLHVPLWIVYLAAPLGFVLAGIQYALTFVRNLTAPEVYLSFDKLDEYEEAPPADM